MPAATLSPRRKVATVLVALGPERAATLLRALPEELVADLATDVAEIGQLSPEEAQSALREVAEEVVGRQIAAVGGLDYARDLLARVIGPERASELSDQIDPSKSRPFAYLGSADPEVAGRVLAVEPPSSVALALAHLRPEVSARILQHLPDRVQGEVAMRVATLDHVHPDVIAQVDADFGRRVRPLLDVQTHQIEGIEVLTGLLGHTSRQREKEILKVIEEINPELAAKIREALFLFEDIAQLDDRSIQQVLKAVDTKDLAIALKDGEEEVRDAVLRNLSERARENLLEEMEYLDNLRATEIRDARKNVVKAVQALEEEGAIVIDRAGDDEE